MTELARPSFYEATPLGFSSVLKTEDQRRVELRRRRTIATSLLVLMSAIYLATRFALAGGVWMSKRSPNRSGLVVARISPCAPAPAESERRSAKTSTERSTNMSSTATTAPVGAATTDIAVSDSAAIQSVADAMRDAASTATERATDVNAAVGDAAPRALRAISRATYTTAYVVSYCVAYATVFAVQSVLLENPFVRGLRAGGVAAREDQKGA